MASIYVERLIKRVIELSQSSDWDTAVAEWEIADCEEDDIPAILAIPDTLFFQPAFPFSDYCLKRGKAQSAKDRPAKS